MRVGARALRRLTLWMSKIIPAFKCGSSWGNYSKEKGMRLLTQRSYHVVALQSVTSLCRITQLAVPAAAKPSHARGQKEM